MASFKKNRGAECFGFIFKLIGFFSKKNRLEWKFLLLYDIMPNIKKILFLLWENKLAKEARVLRFCPSHAPLSALIVMKLKLESTEKAEIYLPTFQLRDELTLSARLLLPQQWGTNSENQQRLQMLKFLRNKMKRYGVETFACQVISD